MVCSYGDQNDVALFRELQLDEVIAIGLDGRMTEVARRISRIETKTSQNQNYRRLGKCKSYRKN